MNNTFTDRFVNLTDFGNLSVLITKIQSVLFIQIMFIPHFFHKYKNVQLKWKNIQVLLPASIYICML